MDWWKRLLTYVANKEPEQKEEIIVVPEKKPDISEPILTILKTMDENGRWILDEELSFSCHSSYYNFKDTKTELEFQLKTWSGLKKEDRGFSVCEDVCHSKGLEFATKDELEALLSKFRSVKRQQVDQELFAEREKIAEMYKGE